MPETMIVKMIYVAATIVFITTLIISFIESRQPKNIESFLDTKEIIEQ